MLNVALSGSRYGLPTSSARKNDRVFVDNDEISSSNGLLGQYATVSPKSFVIGILHNVFPVDDEFQLLVAKLVYKST